MSLRRWANPPSGDTAANYSELAAAISEPRKEKYKVRPGPPIAHGSSWPRRERNPSIWSKLVLQFSLKAKVASSLKLLRPEHSTHTLKAKSLDHYGEEDIRDLPKLTHCGASSWAFFHPTFGLLGYWNSLFPLEDTEALNEDNRIYCSSLITLLKKV